MAEPASGESDQEGGEPRPSALRTVLVAPAAAITLLTVLPMARGVQARIGSREVAAAAAWFPLVGGLIGLLAGLVASVVADHGGPLLAGALAATVMAMLTGALHLDGLADSADALGARGGQPARRLEIMRDSSTGAYGAVAITAWFALTVAAVSVLPPDRMVGALVWVGVVSRTAAVMHAVALPPARALGLGAGFAVSRAGAALAGALMALVGTVLALGGGSDPFVLPGLTAVAVSVVVAAFVAGRTARAAFTLVGGRTGDTLGATVSLTEVAALVTLAIALAP